MKSLSERVLEYGVKDKFKLLEIIEVKKKRIPDYLFQVHDKGDIVIINPENDMNDYYNQPLIVIPANDYLAQLANLKIPPKRRFRKQGRAEK